MQIGKIIGTHGLNGWLKFHPFTSGSSLFAPGEKIRIGPDDGQEGSNTKQGAGKIRTGANRSAVFAFFTVSQAIPHKKIYRLRLEGIDSIDQAEPLVGFFGYVEKDLLPETDEGEYYWCDLIGLAVNTMDGESLGRLEHIFETGAHDVFVVSKGDREVLIPAVDLVVKMVDVENGCITVDLPEGL